MDKSPEAFRTISEVAEALDVPPHVLRFWETRFTQVKPVKRGGGRRYYRPEDVRLLRGIRGLLYDDGMTIKGVQKILRERGIRHVIGLGTIGNDESAPGSLLPPGTPASADARPAPNGAVPDLAATVEADDSSAPAAQADLFETATLLVAEAPARTETLSEPSRAPKPIDKAALATVVAELQALRDVMISGAA